MNDDGIGAIIYRMMRDLDDDNHEPNRKPRCESRAAKAAAPASRSSRMHFAVQMAAMNG
jgi:hypothetical protein